MDEKLRKLQLAELEILDEFVRICNRHSLKYYLVGGTLLGAVRHQGFIPWDDDIDVAMPRKDYDALAQLWAEEADPAYFYQCPDTDPYYFLSYAKIRKNGTEVYEERFRDAKFHKGIFIDIFPLDYCPAPGVICHVLFNILAVMNYRGQVDSGEAYEPYKELSGKLGYGILRIFSANKLVKIRQQLIRISNRRIDRTYLASYSGAYGYHKEIYPKSWFANGRTVRFEGRKVLAPALLEQELEQVFGINFMMPPPETERKQHIIIERD